MPRRNVNRFRKRKPIMARTKKDFNQDKRLKRVETKVRKIQNEADLKYHDVIVSAAQVTTSGSIQLLNGIGNGTSDNARIGDKIRITSLQFRVLLESNPEAVGDPNIIRFLIVRDRQANSAVLTPIGVPTTTLAVLNNSVINLNVAMPYMHEANHRFRVLYDKTVVLNPSAVGNVTSGSTTEYNTEGRYISKYIKLNMTTKYNGITNAIASIGTNSLYLIMLSNNSTNTPSFTGGFRIYYRDI